MVEYKYAANDEEISESKGEQSVSYTHLDVYKRQDRDNTVGGFNNET